MSDNQAYRDQVADLLLKDPITGADCYIVSPLRNGPGGFLSFDVQGGPDAPKWRIELRITEAK